MDWNFLTTAAIGGALFLNHAAGAADLAPANERSRKFDLALRTLGIPPEPAPDYSAFPTAGNVRNDDVLSIARAIDPDGGLRRYLSIRPDRIDLFPGFFTPTTPDSPEFGVATGAPTNRDSPDLIARLDRTAANVRAGRARPLAGLKIVIDPGHMGSAFWNELDGKYVKVGGKTVAEGELTLATGKILANELEALGATVRLTRLDLNPVTPYTWENFDPRERLADYYYRSLDDWMGKYLALSDAELVRQLPNAPEVRKMGTRAGKIYLYLQEDMAARARFTDAEKPDVFIDLHFDSMEVDELQSRTNDISVYVPGGFRKNETGARNQRADALKHLLDVRRWKQSAKMAKTLVTAVGRKLGVPLLKDGIETSVKVSDGVFARNVYQTKRSTTGLTAFFESFHYDHTSEFPRLTVKDRQATYRGTPFRYPSRLDAISTGIREGLIQYFREFATD